MAKKMNYPADCKHEWWEPDPEFERFQGAVLKPQRMCRLCGSVIDYIPLKRDLLILGWRPVKE